MPQIKSAQNIWTDFTHDKSAVGSKTGNCKHLPHFGLNFGDLIVHLHKKQCYDHKLGFRNIGKPFYLQHSEVVFT